MPIARAVTLLTAAVLAAAGASPTKTTNLILITSDGLRWQDAFTGIDAALMNEKGAGMEHAQALRERLWRSTPRERREALMPFFWKQLVLHGVASSNLKVSNAYRVSYPGYSEILTGRAADRLIRGNDKIQNPNETVLEFLQGKLKLATTQVALFASWETFSWIGEHTPGSIFINSGYREAHGPHLAPISRLQFEMLTPWDGSRHDYVTFEMALEYLKAAKPRVLYIALDETDDWAHDKRYDRVLAQITNFDRWLEKLWTTLESMPEYRGSTTVIVTADHGRGSTLDDWHSHGEKIAGADRIWLALAGPDTPARGEVNQPAAQRDIAPTMIKLLGLDPRAYKGAEGSPIRFAFNE